MSGPIALDPSLNDPDFALVFGGGNALGAYHAGAFEALSERGLVPGWIAGASIGAVTGAIIAGNAPEERVARLRRFWDEARLQSGPDPAIPGRPRQVYNGLHALAALAWGRPNLFRHRWPGLWSALPFVPNDVALFDHGPILDTLARLVDFDRLNGGGIRFTVACVDLATGEEVLFDSARERIRPEHILASTAILPAFPPVAIDGRVLCDAGYTNNLPLDPVFADEPERDLVCLALELFSLRAPPPASLDAVLERANDLIFASAGRRTIAALDREYALRQQLRPDGPAITLIHSVYQAGADELAAKSFDYSPASIRDRWEAGRRDVAALAARVARPGPRERRFRVVALHGSGEPG